VAAETIHGVGVDDLKLVGTSFKCLTDLSPEFPEVGQASSAHPNDEVG